ncbi:Shikimate kinase I [Candidatus Vidania fulgoroideae]|nr:Shikimate kinase I [Candidatus Vidania fulgoroideae]
MLVSFIGLTGTGKSTSNRIYCFFNKLKHLDADLFFNRIYILDNIFFLKKKSNERLFRNFEKSILFFLKKKKHVSLGGGFFLSNSLLYLIVKEKSVIFKTEKILPVFYRERNFSKIKENKKITRDRFNLINFLYFKKI